MCQHMKAIGGIEERVKGKVYGNSMLEKEIL
jgi:hypothetical protein